MRGIFTLRPTTRIGKPSASGLDLAVSRTHWGSQPIIGATSAGRSMGVVDVRMSAMFIWMLLSSESWLLGYSVIFAWGAFEAALSFYPEDDLSGNTKTDHYSDCPGNK